MRGSYQRFFAVRGDSNKTQTIENALALEKEAAELRLARIQNGAEPSHKNGTNVIPANHRPPHSGAS